MYRIGEVAAQAQVSKRTIDYYTNLGLLIARRSEANYRLYPEDTLERLRFIESLKRRKFSLEEIKEQMAGWQAGGIKREAIEVVQHVQEIQGDMRRLEERVQELKMYLKTLDEKQARLVARQLSVQSGSLLQTLMLLLGDAPF
ncbi:MerR family transcriptional regulator [Aneurinibacillus aneurinilyticus]|uniref:MerR family transcriptional regulator n=2 Tax=Aneurinibacillus aneurinilyticus TaxID=1391 RepID=A0A848CU42_ANEAE|nr:MerR family transcriptional regulator [Aneurinibacillus aneurinilyticus]ERI05898.1 transcriptional regulator, MerR family [Aneurinibacillus aneurinilyticus ATCC 12856]MCI1692654.1 MerR family transcriptional regulator [Aneurinibacillus aneurinilyticus]MED0672757.1 MerR family transcriptional regulator [Aneurinibacillus aneurinilyticus]MED0708584.1 MerR family transcriptional regulator [Aneurinibacillus aneurinilyticus]MED0721744.1 MerR family transcriptional regulator [Aneurinibacillus aneu